MTASFEKSYVQEDANFVADKKLNNIPELESKFNVTIEEAGSFDYSISKDKTLRVFDENLKVNIPAIVEGSKLKNSGILIDPAYAKANKIKVGDSIDISNKAFKVNGFMSLPNYIYPLKSESDLLNDPNSFGIAVITKADFSAMNRGNIFYSIKYIGDKKDVENKLATFKDYVKSNNVVILRWINTSENPRVTYVTAKIDGINQVSSTIPVCMLLLTCILTGIVMWRMLKRESKIIGTLYALGYKKKEIMKHYLTYSIYIAILGGVIGTVLGALTLRPMLKFMISYFNMPMDSITFNLKYMITSILLPIIFLVICGYFVVNRALKYSPVDLMRGGREKDKVGFIEKRLSLDKFKFNTKFKIREQLRSIPRSIFLLLGVTMATMLLLFGFAAKNSMDFLMKDTYESTYKYQYQYIFNSLEQGAPASGEVFSMSPFTLKSDSKTSFSVCGINTDSKYIMLKDNSGKKLIADKVIITRPLADKLKVKPKDTIVVLNKLDSREYNITVDSIAETYVGENIYMPLASFNEMLSYPKDSYTGIWSLDKLDIPENRLLAAATIDDFKKSFEAVTQPLQYAVGTMSFFSFIIGLIVIYVVTSLVIEENKENISLMKIMGYRKKEVYSLILNSSALIVVIGYILGVPLILASLTAMFKSATKDMNFSFPVRIDYIYVLVGFIIIYLTYEISKILSRRKVNRISMADALKSGLE
jgi:putative ABC transport system permease protein